MPNRRKTDFDNLGGLPESEAGRPSRLIEVLNENAKLKQELARARTALRQEIKQANSDPLTELFNKRGLERSLRSIDKSTEGIVIAMDMRYLKLVNDTYGHQAGDAAISHFSNTLKNNLRQGNIIARTGGDEFIIILPQTKATESWQIRLRLKRALAKPFVYNTHKLKIGVRMGVARFNNKISIDEAIKTADKREGKIRDNLRKKEPPRYGIA